jgi:hypothetical protein
MPDLDLDDLARSTRGLPEERARVECLSFDRTGRWLAAVAYGVLVVYDLRDATRHAEVALPTKRGVRSLGFSADGRRVVVALADEPRAGDSATLLVVDLAASAVERGLPDEAQRPALRDVTRLRESLTAWVVTPSGEAVVTGWGRAGLATFALNGNAVETRDAPATSESTPGDIVALAFAGTRLVCQTDDGLYVDEGSAWRRVAKETFGRGVLVPSQDGARVVVAGHAPRRLGQVFRSGGWIVRLSDGAVNFDAVKAEGMAPVAVTHDASRVWWAKPVERFTTRPIPLVVHCHDLVAGTFAQRLSDAKKAASTSVAIDPAGDKAAFGRLKSIGVFALSP